MTLSRSPVLELRAASMSAKPQATYLEDWHVQVPKPSAGATVAVPIGARIGQGRTMSDLMALLHAASTQPRDAVERLQWKAMPQGATRSSQSMGSSHWINGPPIVTVTSRSQSSVYSSPQVKHHLHKQRSATNHRD